MVSRQGLGCMGMSIIYGQPDDAASLSTLHRALDLGVNMIVTSDAYGNGVNETLVGKALAGRREEAVVCTKFGNLALAGGGDTGFTGGHPSHAAIACDRSLKRLGVDVIDLYALHRVDPTVPIEDTVGAMKRLVEQGKVRFLGLSEAGSDTILRAHKVHPITSLETEYSIWSRDVEDGILATCRTLGIALMAYSPLGRGFLTGAIMSTDALGEKDGRRNLPRFKPEHMAKNVELLEKMRHMAASKGVTIAQLALAWVHAQGADIFPIPGTKKVKYLEQNLAAAELQLSRDELNALSQLFSKGVASGGRYPDLAMKGLGI
ncbi:aldo/keto reductase [Limnohabitans sp.]|uniref:aldo/keto reductase n=1 Tax=Limnohabitans sp. TaxID=1907725 RepID=UPI003342314B